MQGGTHFNTATIAVAALQMFMIFTAFFFFSARSHYEQITYFSNRYFTDYSVSVFYWGTILHFQSVYSSHLLFLK